MAQFIYYQDGNEKKGPLDEKTVLELYNGAEFTSDVAFQIRSSETDDAAPFIQLRDLISKNGPSNPFCGDLDRRIEEAEKELEELRAIVGRKEQLEETIAKIERVAASFPELFDAKKAESDGTAPSTSGEKKKGKLHKCTSCGLMLANCKQALIHSHRDCPCFTPKDEGVVPDIARWKEEDEGRLSMGRRLFDRMKEEEKGNARPRVDFMEDLSLKLKKFMSFATDEGREKSMEYLESAEAKKVNDRFEKHLEGAKGMLVCNRCKVACKTHVHFRIHLATYDHRIKVKSTPCELISLLMGWFNRDLYLRKADPSELDEGVDPVSQLSMDSLRLTGDETTLVR